MNFDPQIRSMWNLGLYRVRPQTAPRRLRARLRRRLWRTFVQPMLSPEFRSSEIHKHFDELSLKKPAREEDIVADPFTLRSRPVEVDWAEAGTDWDFPFRKISSFLQERDLVVINLETPLTDQARDKGLFKSDPNYATAMRRAGITAVNLSNNHIFDAGEKGFHDTLDHLEQAGVKCLGIGDNLEDARAGKIIEVAGTKYCFLSYTQFCNSRFASLAGAQSGLLPLDRKLMVEDIARAKDKADLVIISLHWGFENQPSVHPAQTEMAHELIDAGADCLIGHHPHVPHAVEVYRGRPIIYSLGNFIFAQRNHARWSDNFLCELIVAGKEIRGMLIHPLAGRGSSTFQPEILTGSAADAILQNIRIKSIVFKTDLYVRDGVGYLSTGSAIEQPRANENPRR